MYTFVDSRPKHRDKPYIYLLPNEYFLVELFENKENAESWVKELNKRTKLTQFEVIEITDEELAKLKRSRARLTFWLFERNKYYYEWR